MFKTTLLLLVTKWIYWPKKWFASTKSFPVLNDEETVITWLRKKFNVIEKSKTQLAEVVIIMQNQMKQLQEHKETSADAGVSVTVASTELEERY